MYFYGSRNFLETKPVAEELLNCKSFTSFEELRWVLLANEGFQDP
jgi:hypothetical protein